MKCTHCGGNIGLEDKVCPYCGTPNENALGHQEDMRRFEASFKETKAHVEERSSRFSRLAVPVTLAVILLLAMIASVVFSASSYDIGRRLAVKERAKHADEYKTRIDELLSEKDYMRLHALYDHNNLYILSGEEGSPLESYQMIFRACADYSQLFEMLMQRMESGSYYYTQERFPGTCGELADLLDRLNRISRESYFPDSCFSDERLADIAGIQQQAQAMLVTYAGFSSEEAAHAADYSKARLETMFEEKLKTLMQEVDQDEDH